jgi:hypothetical protein
MQTPLLQSHPVFIPMESLFIIWDFRLRILDLRNRYALSIYNRQNCLILKSNAFRKIIRSDRIGPEFQCARYA